MGFELITTNTHDTADFAKAQSASGVAPSLIRFFRADDPFDPVEVFPLSGRVQWPIGRLHHSQSDAPHEGRIWSHGDGNMSGRHAILGMSQTGWILADAGSKNGTFVNGERLSGPHALQDGDVVECGHSFFVFREAKAPSPRPMGIRPAALELPPLYYQIASIHPYITSDMSIHLFGETGTGKEVVARAIHSLSGRKGAFVGVNCAAIPESLFESELFGHLKGAFSGAVERKPGQILSAQDGSLFLDEIGELPLAAQAKLLRVLEQREVVPIGSSKPIPVNFRLISATLCDLRQMVEKGKFRRDLYARLGHVLAVPPLRQHIEEIGPLVQAFLTARLEERRKSTQTLPRLRFTMAASRALIRYEWPLNVRELKLCVEAALISAIADSVDPSVCVIDLHHLPEAIACGSAEVPLPPRLSLSEAAPAEQLQEESAASRRAPRPRPSAEEIQAALAMAEGHRSKAAQLLGVQERTLYRWIKGLNVSA